MDPLIRMSANNVRDIIRLFLKRGIVQSVAVSGIRHPNYQLTPKGIQLQELLLRAEQAARNPYHVE